MTNPLSPVRLGPEDGDEVMALLRICMPHIARSQPWFEWQYFGTPEQPARLYGIREQDRLVSFYAAVASRVRLNGTVHPARIVQDVVTHPEFRGRGYLHALGARCLSDMRATHELGYTFPNKGSENSFGRLGWHVQSDVPVRDKPLALDASPTAPQHARPLAFTFDEPVSALWESTASILPIGVHRDHAYLNWRYSKLGQRYLPFAIGGERLDALLVLKRYESEAVNCVHVCELIVRPGCEALLLAALIHAERFARESGAANLTAWLPDTHPYSATFDAFGLDRIPVQRTFFSTVESPVVPIGAWHLTQGDSDVY